MNLLKKPFLGFLLVVSSLVLTGCTGNSTAQGSAIPWSRPASWESQVPGMGASPGVGSPGLGR
jgi:hypothetical protein